MTSNLQIATLRDELRQERRIRRAAEEEVGELVGRVRDLERNYITAMEEIEFISPSRPERTGTV